MPSRVDFDWFDIHKQSSNTDIARILDPSYSSTTPYSSAAYLDRHGNLHDPDYRHFPISPSSSSSKHSRSRIPPRPRWESFDQDALDDDEDDWSRPTTTNDSHLRRHSSFSSYQQYRLTHQHNYNNISPPHSFDSDDTVLDDDEEEQEDDFPKSSSSGGCSTHGVSRIILRTKREFSKKRRSLDDARYSPSSPIHLAPFSPASAASASTTAAPLSEDTPSSSSSSPIINDAVVEHHFPLTQTLSIQSTTRSHRSPRASFDLGFVGPRTRSHQHHHHQQQRREEDDEEEPTSPLNQNNNNDNEENISNNTDATWTPTCSQALKRQWQALSLSVRFSVFRAQKKFKRRFSMV